MTTGKETCKLVYMENGQPKECGGKIKSERVHQPFGLHTRIGGGPEPPIFTYKYCSKCGVMLSR